MKYLIVCHDAGGSEIISAWVKENKTDAFSFILEGPAIEIFERKLPSIKNNSRDQISVLIDQSDCLLAGTGWASDLEKRSLIAAMDVPIKTISFLDHWINYRQRFQLKNETNLPDEIWVGDDKALSIAKETFPDTDIKLVPNPYFEEVKQEVSRLSPKKRSKGQTIILYVCEPVEEHARRQYGDGRYWGYTEREALEYFYAILSKHPKTSDNFKILVRPHPAEGPNKYSDIIRLNRAFETRISVGTTLIEDCACADWIVGVSSMGLVIGLVAGKKVFKCVPPKGRPQLLPFREIKNFEATILPAVS